VPTHNRKELLLQLLESLLRQTLPPEECEIIVVCDGVTDGTNQRVRDLCQKHSHLRLVEQTQSGPAAARNAGAHMARGRYIAFTDDDCLAAPDWAEKLLCAFERTGAAAVQGRTTTDRPARSPLTHQVEVLSPWFTAMQTCNAAYAKSVFDAVGGFDESFRFAHDEDADLAWRVEDAGKMVFAPEAHIMHPPRRDTFSKRARWVRGLESDFVLYYKNRDKYRRYVSPSPWLTIYWNVFVVGQIRFAKSNCRYLFRPFKPHYFFVGMALLLARWFNLVRYFPAYLKAQSFCRSTVGAR
jgi:GT2 family glycosyltransferase